MNRRSSYLLIFLFAMLLALGIGALPARADGTHTGLFVQFSPEDSVSACIPLDGEMTSFDLIRASNLSHSIEEEETFAAVCAIDGVGCTSPEEDCFCQCGAEECLLWTNWVLRDGAWELAYDGGDHLITAGTIEAWLWGDGIDQPPDMALADICQEEDENPTAPAPDTPVPTPTDEDQDEGYPGPPTPRPTSSDKYPGAEDETPTPRPTSTRRPTPLATATRTALAGWTATPAGATLSPTRFVQPTRGATPVTRPTLKATPPWNLTPTVQGAVPLAPGPRTVTPAGAGSPAATTPLPTLTPSPAGTPTEDRVALLLSTSVAEQRATAAAVSAKPSRPQRGWIVLPVMLGAALAVYALLLWRQHSAPAVEARSPAVPQTPDAHEHKAPRLTDLSLDELMPEPDDAAPVSAPSDKTSSIDTPDSD